MCLMAEYKVVHLGGVLCPSGCPESVPVATGHLQHLRKVSDAQAVEAPPLPFDFSGSALTLLRPYMCKKIYIKDGIEM